MTTIEQQFINNDGVFICSKCQKRYKQIKLKKPKKGRIYTVTIIKHHKKNCKKLRTRNHTKCQGNEKNVKQYFINLKESGEPIELKNLNGKWRVIELLKNKKKRKYSKNEPMVKIQNINTLEELKIGIQVKSHNFGSFENWPKYNNLTIIDPTILKKLLIAFKEGYEKFQNDLIRYKKRHKNAKFVKFGLNIVPPRKYCMNKITNFDLKKDFIKRIDNPVDHFYYYKQQKKNECFSINKLKYVDDDFINNTEMSICLRPIYTSSGNTSLNTNNIFDFLDEKNQLPKIIHKKMNDDEIKTFLDSLIKKY